MGKFELVSRVCTLLLLGNKNIFLGLFYLTLNVVRQLFLNDFLSVFLRDGKSVFLQIHIQVHLKHSCFLKVFIIILNTKSYWCLNFRVKFKGIYKFYSKLEKSYFRDHYPLQTEECHKILCLGSSCH